MQPSPPYDDILEDETLAPLKRNHACLQCKKRKVKCDAIRPTCNPCMRSHAHALRSAQRNKTRPPPLVCTYADDDDGYPDTSVSMIEVEAERKRTSSAAPTVKRTALGADRNLVREREKRAQDERDILKSRIAELESRLAEMSTEPKTQPKSWPVNGQGTQSAPSVNGPWTAPMSVFPAQLASIDSTPSVQPPFVSIEAGEPGVFQSFDFSNLLMLPLNWPKNLPSPAILEHLVETFFQCEPVLPRMLHRGTLLSRMKLPPTHPDFPFPGLLHAICAAAAPHTAWMKTVPPDDLEASRERHIKAGLDLETSEDFSTAQCECAERCIRIGTMTNMMGSGQYIFDLVRAHLVMSYTYLNKGMALRAWMCGAVPGRLLKALELLNRNPRKTEKPPLIQDAKTDREREERLATVWIAYITESGFSANSCWSQSLPLKEILVSLPTSTDEFNQAFDTTGFMKMNPQTAHDPDVLVNHPLPDPFVLSVKASFLLGKTAEWLVGWQQRVIKPGDDMEGMNLQSFKQLTAEIMAFQLSIPVALKNVYRLVDSGNMSTFSADLLSLHLFPHLAMLLLYEPFVDWRKDDSDSPALRAIQKTLDAAVGLLHLIPSQLDITLVLTPLHAFSLFSIGRFIVRFITRSNRLEQYALAMRWRADQMAVQNLLSRYGARHQLGAHLILYITNHQRMHDEGKEQLTCIEPPKASTPPTYTPSTSPWNPSGLRSSSASASGTARTPNTSNTSSNSMGHTPESVEVVDNQTRFGMNVDPTLPAMNGFTPNPSSMNGTPSPYGTHGLPSDQLFDTSLLEFLDPTAAAQVSAALGQNHPFDKQNTDQLVSEILMASTTMGGDGFNWNQFN